MSNTITYTGVLVTVTCWCGLVHAVPEDLYQYQRRQHDNGEKPIGIFCPLGHTWVPGGKGQAQLERERRERLQAALTHAQDQAAAERRAHIATKGQLTKARKRAAAALCPVPGCGRSFVQLGRHLHAKHPDFVHDHTIGGFLNLDQPLTGDSADVTED